MNTQHSKPTTRAVLYRRVSTDHQSLGLDAQESKLEPYAAAAGLVVVDSHHDQDVSGTSSFSERPGGGLCMRALRDGRAQHLVVAKLDRLGRSVADILAVIDEVHGLGCYVHFVDIGGGSVDTRSPWGRFMITMLGAIAELEVQMIRQRTKDVLTSKRARGEMVSHLPYGKRIAGKNDAGKTIIEDDPAEQAILQQMAWWRHGEGLSYNAIARRLNMAGVPTKTPPGTTKDRGNGHLTLTSGLWGCGNVARILNNAYNRHLRARNPANSGDGGATGGSQ